jgi:hypothetical protein
MEGAGEITVLLRRWRIQQRKLSEVANLTPAHWLASCG